MLATRQMVGGLARARGLRSAAAMGTRALATVSDSPLDRKVKEILSTSSIDQAEVWG